jgi:Fe-S-cluster containining protein
MTAIGIDEPFQFACSPEVPCFNACCQDLVQFLTPYDILRLKRNLKMTSPAFLAQYTRGHIGPETGLPIVTLRTRSQTDKHCIFVSPRGCRVYPDRPSSCRSYPVVRAIARDPDSRQVTEHFALLKETHCQGFTQRGRQTIRKWMVEQEIDLYNQYNDPMLEIITLKRKTPGALDLKDQLAFRMVLYDLDTFRDHIINKGILKDFSISDTTLKKAETDDLVLLQLAYRWIKQTLFNR